jgi:hypothetical protein
MWQFPGAVIKFRSERGDDSWTKKDRKDQEKKDAAQGAP